MKDSEKSKEGIVKLCEAAQYLRTHVYKDFPIQQIIIFLLVVMEEGITLNELIKRMTIDKVNQQSAVSRNVKELSNYALLGPNKERIDKGHGLLIKTQNEFNTRELAVYLSQKGKKVAAALEKIITG